MGTYKGTLVLSVMFSLALGGCATAGGRPAARDSDLLTADEIQAAVGVHDAWDAVQRLRPHFLSRRGAISLQRPDRLEDDLPTVYVNGQMYGSADRLREIDVDTIESIRFLDAAQANLEYGPGHFRGVIEVTLRERERGIQKPT